MNIFLKLRSIIYNDKLFKKRFIISFLVSIILSFLSVYGFQIEYNGIIKLIDLNFLIYLLIYFIIVFSLFYIFDSVIIKNKKIRIKDDLIFFLSSGFLSIVYFVFLLGLYPGIYAYDSSEQFYMYYFHTINEHHPVLHTLFFGYIVNGYSYMQDFNIGGFAYSVIQLILMSFGFSFVTLYVYKKTKNFILWIISILFYSFFPPIILQVLSATKDSLFLCFMMITIILTIVLIDYEKKIFDNKAYVVVWIASFVLMTILRNNAVYAVPFLIIGILFSTKKSWKKSILIISIGLVIFLLYKFVAVPNIVDKKVDDREKLSVPIQQLDRIYNSSEADLSADEKVIIENLLGEGLEHYNPRISDWPKALIDMDYYYQHRKEISKMYKRVIRKNPKIALESFLENTLGYWYPYCTLAFYYDGEIAYWPVESWELWYFDPKIPYILEYFKIFEESDFILYNPIAKTFFYPGSFFYLFVIMFGYSIYKKKTSYNVIFFFTLMLLGTYFLGPVALVRYAIYLYAFVPLYLSMIGNKEKQK